MEQTFKIYEKLPISQSKCFIGEKKGVLINNGTEPGFFKETVTGAIYPMYNYSFEEK